MAKKQGILSFLYCMTREKKQSNHFSVCESGINHFQSVTIIESYVLTIVRGSVKYLLTYLLIYTLSIFLSLTQTTYFQHSCPVIEISLQKIGVKNIWFVLKVS